MVVSLDAVLGNGDDLTAHRRPAGRDLTPLLVGSEGTLGVLTRLRLRLHHAPAHRAFLGFEFPNMDHGAEALRRLYQAGLRPAVARLYDPLDSFMLGDGTKPKKPRRGPDPFTALALGAPRVVGAGIALAERFLLKRCKLITIFEGDSEDVREDAARAEALVQKVGGRALGEGIARHWFSRRYAVSYRQSEVFRTGAFSDTMEVAAPWSRLSALNHAVHAALGRHALVMAHMSHAYPDGCSIYFTFVARPRKSGAVRTHETLWREALAAAHEAGGTVSHHHGVGRLRGEFLAQELGAGGAFSLAAVKRAWDPSGILCPGTPLSELHPPSRIGRPVGSDADEAVEKRNALKLDEISELVRLAGELSLRDAVGQLRARGHELRFEPDARSVREWVAAGLPGMPDSFDDPVEQRVAGFAARLNGGVRLRLDPVPRRALGPDPFALFAGSAALGSVESLWLRAPRIGAQRARVLRYAGAAPPPVSGAEERAWSRIQLALER
jgi:alkyldihydroxyacetonephosphate synthase